MYMMTICTPMREDESKRKGRRVGPRCKGRENMEKENKRTSDRRQDDITVREEGKEGRERKEEKRRKGKNENKGERRRQQKRGRTGREKKWREVRDRYRRGRNGRRNEEENENEKV